MKCKIELKDRHLEINSKPIFLFSGEVHYFRIKKHQWLDRIKKAKKANLNTISSYIPWCWHSPKENKFDFNGETFPERDLIYFLELLKEEQIYFIARIGPVCNGEILNDGLPQWLLEKYPEIRLKDYAGRTNPYSTLIDYHHPQYLEQVENWYNNLLPILKKYLINNRGPVILIQLDNEISMLNWLTKSPNYSKYSNRLFQEFLKEKYKTIENINKKLNVHYSNFNEIKQPAGNFEKEKGEFYFEWSEYYRRYYALYYRKLFNIIKKHNIDLPVIANIPQIYDYDVKGRGNMGIMTTSMFKKFGEYVNEIIFGGAYQYRRVDYENFTDISAMTEIIRMITPAKNPVICAEMQTGIMFDRPVLYPSDVELNIKTSIGTGLNGINCYMFAGGENFLNTGGFGNYHNWQAAVADSGKLAPHYDKIKQIGQILKNFQKLIVKTENVQEINIGLYLPYYQTEYLKGNFIENLILKRDTKFFDGLLRLIRLAGFNYRFVDIKEIDIKNLEHLYNLWIFTLEFMDKDTQQKIIEFIKNGKKLFLYPTIPVYDLNFKKCDYLKKYLGIKKISHSIGANRIKKPQDNYLYYGGDEIYSFFLNPSASLNIEPLFFTEKNEIAAFKIKKENSDIIICGFDLSHKFDYQIDFIEEFAEDLNTKKQIINNNRKVNVLLRHSDIIDILFISNYTEIPQTAKINLYKRAYPVDMKINIPGRKSLIIFTNFKITEDLFIYFITAEITKIKRINKEIKLAFRNHNHEIFLCYNGRYEIKTSEKVSLIKCTEKYILMKILTSNKISEIIFNKL